MYKTILVHSGQSCGTCGFTDVLGVFDTTKEALKAAIEFIKMEEYPQLLELWKGKLGVLWNFEDNSSNLYHVVYLNNELYISKEKLLEKLERIYKSGV
jgi:hypothetical protein